MTDLIEILLWLQAVTTPPANGYPPPHEAGFWLMFWIALAFQVVGELLRPKQKFDDAKPSSLGDFQFPTADQTRIIGKFWGTCKLEGPNTTWFGDLRSQPIIKKVKTGWFSSDRVKQGYRYYLGVQMVFALGYLDELIDFRIDNKSVLRNVETTPDYFRWVMNAPTLLDTDDPKNGVSGPVVVYRGTRTQVGNEYLTGQWNEPGGASGFRDVVYAVFEHCYLGNSDTPPPPALIGKSVPNPLGLTDGRHDIDGDANFANAIYETMTDTFWGMRMDPAEFDLASFVYAGNLLAAEAFGVSMMIDTPRSGRELVAELLRYIDGVVYKDPVTALWTLRLARDDYDVGTLRNFDNSNILPEGFEFSRTSWSETKNTTVVNYVDRSEDFNKLPVQWQDPANVFVRGGLIDMESHDFPGLSNKAAASVVAARLNKASSSPLARIQFKCLPRVGRSVRPADVLKITKPDRGLFGVIIRVLDVDYGTLEDPTVTVMCTEDIFAVNAMAYDPPADTGWIPVWAKTLPLQAARMMEVPYEMIDVEARYVMVLGVRGDFSTEGFEVWSGNSTDEMLRLTGKSSGTLAGGVLEAVYEVGVADDPVGFIVEDVKDETLLLSVTAAERQQGKNLLLVGDEIMAWQDATQLGGGRVAISNILRGVMDTVAVRHLAGSQVYFFNETVPRTDALPYPDDRTVLAMLPTYSGDFILPIAESNPVAVATNSRALRPNPPGRFRIGGVSNYQVGPQAGTVEITWSPRNKTLPGVLSQDDALTMDEGQAGVVVDITIRDADTGALLLHNADAYDPIATFRLSESRNVRVELRSIDFDGQLSLRAQVAEFAYTTTGGTNRLVVGRSPVFNPEGAVALEIVDGVVTIDCRYTDFTLALNQDATVEFVNVPQDHVVILQLTQMAPGGHDLILPANVQSISGVPYNATPVIGAVDLIGMATTSAGLSWDLKAEQPIPDSYDEYVVDITPNPADDSVITDGTTAAAPSVQVTAAVLSGGAPEVPALITWTRNDNNGGTDFLISDDAVTNPTFSIPAGTNAAPISTQQWRIDVQSPDGREAHDVVAVTLERVLMLDTIHLEDRTIVDARVPPREAEAGFHLDNDRNAYMIGGFGGTRVLYQWLPSGDAANYQVLASVVSGAIPTGPLDAYVGLETDRLWTISNGGGGNVSTVLQITIQDKATSTVHATAQVTLTAKNVESA